MNQPWQFYVLLPIIGYFVYVGDDTGLILSFLIMILGYASRIYDKVCCDKRESGE